MKREMNSSKLSAYMRGKLDSTIAVCTGYSDGFGNAADYALQLLRAINPNRATQSDLDTIHDIAARFSVSPKENQS